MTDPTDIVSLDDVKGFIGIPLDETTDDVVLQWLLDGATRWATYVSDAIVPTTYTDELHSGGTPHIVLFNAPIIEVDSVTEYVGQTAYELTQAEAGTNLTYSYSIDNASMGILSRRWNGFVGSFIGGRNNIKVTYKAGFTVIPADIQLAVLMDIQVLYSQTQLGQRPGANNRDQFSATLPLNAFPRLENLMTSSRRVPAIG